MKLVLIILVALVGIWVWRSSRQQGKELKNRSGVKPPTSLDMVRCRLCSVHVPAVDAVQGKLGMYCSADHLGQAEP